MSLQVGFNVSAEGVFYKFLANLKRFDGMRSSDSFFDKTLQRNGEFKSAFFIPLLNISPQEVMDFEAIVSSVRKYAFLNSGRDIASSISVESYSLSQSNGLKLIGKYNIPDVANVFLDLKLLFEKEFRESDFIGLESLAVERFSSKLLAPELKIINSPRSDLIDDLLFEVQERMQAAMSFKINHFAYRLDIKDETTHTGEAQARPAILNGLSSEHIH